MPSNTPNLSDRSSQKKRRNVTIVLLVLLFIAGISVISKLDSGEGQDQAFSVVPVPSAVRPPFDRASLPITTISLPAQHADTTIELSISTQLHIPQAAFTDSAGTPIDEPVTLEFQEMMNPLETFLSGIPMELDSGRVLKSAGMVRLQGSTESGNPIIIRSDRALQLEFASIDADTAYTAWALDTVSGVWSEIDAQTTVAVSDEMEKMDELEKRIPFPPVVAQDYSFTIGDETGFYPELEEYEHVKFQPIDGEPCGFTCTEINVFPQKNGVYDIQFIGHEYGYQNIAREETCPCYLAFDEGRNYSEALKQYQRVNRKALDKRDRERKRIERARRRHMRALARQELTRENELASWRQKSADRRVTRTLEVLQFGILNIDKPYVIDAPVELMASYTDSLGAPLLLENLQVMDIGSRVLYPCKNERVQLHPMQKQVLFGTTPSGDLAFVHIHEIKELNASMTAYKFPMRIARKEELSPEALVDLLLPA
mgnify:FL=1